MGTRLFVGNLSYGTTEASLRAHFQSGGRTVVDATIVMDRETGRSRGFGFIELETPEMAQAAIEELDGAELDSRRLAVREARERAPRPARGGPPSRPGPGGGAGGRFRPSPERSYVRGGGGGGGRFGRDDGAPGGGGSPPPRGGGRDGAGPGPHRGRNGDGGPPPPWYPPDPSPSAFPPPPDPFMDPAAAKDGGRRRRRKGGGGPPADAGGPPTDEFGLDEGKGRGRRGSRRRGGGGRRDFDDDW